MTRPIGELGKDVKKLHEEYFAQLDEIGAKGAKAAELELLKTFKAIMLNYTYLKSNSDLNIEPDAENMPRVWDDFFFRPQTLRFSIRFVSLHFKMSGVYFSISTSSGKYPHLKEN